MILLVVVAFLALFSVMGVTYIIYADSQLRQTADDVNAQDVRQNPIKMVDLDPSFILNFFLERFLYDQADISGTSATPDSVYSALRGHSLSRNMYGWNDTANALNDKPFSGTGKLNRQIMVEGQNIEEWKIVNLTAFRPFGPPVNPVALPIIDPERGLRIGDNNTRSATTSSWNAPYTYPDHNNFYLGWLKSDGSKVQPSFHRDYIFGHGQIPADTFNLPVAITPSTSKPTGNLNWINSVGKYLSARPRPVDHLSTLDLNSLPVLPNNPTQIEINVRDNATINLINQRIFETKLFPYPEADGMDVKNLEGYPGGNDSIWIDVGSPVFKSADGRKYKIMIAPLILDLDGKINLNVAGNVMGSLKDPLNPHASNQGWGPWEVNPARIAQSVEVQTMINSYSNPNTGIIQLPGRYTNTLRIPAGADGSTVNYPSSPSYSMVDYNGTLDNGAVGNEGYFKIPAFNDLNAVSPFQSFPYFPTKNYGAAGNAEIKTVAGDYNHASLYNPLRPTYSSKLGSNNLVVGPNRGFSPKETASLLNWGSKSGTLSSSSLMQFFSNSMEPQNPNTTNPQNTQTIKNRSFITTLSSDLARITTPPYIANSAAVGSPYQMPVEPLPPLPPLIGNYPKGNDIAYAPNGTAVPTGSTSDTETVTSMGGAVTTSLRSINSQNMKVDLSRSLSAYPAVNTAFTGAVGGGGGRYAMNTNSNAAIIDRQKFALDIFTALLKATGAKDMSQQAQFSPGVGITDTDYEANRYLAQLAANMVDYIDSDDVMTKFIWKYDRLQFSKTVPDPANPTQMISYSPCRYEPTFWEDSNGNILKKMDGSIDIRNATLDERVYGTELNKVVLNEVYAEIINEPGDPFTPVMMKEPATKPFQVHFWVELMNPLPAATAPGSLVNHAILQQDPIAAVGDSSVYQLEIRDQSAVDDIFKPDNSLGETRLDADGNDRSKGVVSSFPPAVAGGASVNLIAPAAGNYLGTENAANGFIVLGSTTTFPNDGPVYDGVDQTKNEIPKPFTSINNIANIKSDKLKYPIPIDTPGYEKAKFANSMTPLQTTNKPSLVLRRLANPYMPPQSNAANPNYNPYVTVDVMNDIKVNDGVTNATDDKKAVPPTVENRSSVVRQQPYQETGRKNVSGLIYVKDVNDVSMNMVKPLVKQPQHTFLRQNGTLSEAPNAGINAADGLLNLPFNWLVHLDRVPISLPEIMHVSGVAPKNVTKAFNNAAFTDGTNPIGHKAPWLDGGSRLARFLEFAQVKSRQAGVAQDGRIPGLVNINSIWDEEVFNALCDANNNNNFTQAEVKTIFNQFVNTRSPLNAPVALTDPPVNNVPGLADNPFWSLGVGKSAGGDEWTANPRGLDNTILRNNATFFDLPATNTLGQNRDAYQKKELLTKIFNSITTKSNTFGVWLTAGFFEVTDDTVKPAKLGAEIGKADGTNIRHRMFAIVDRTNMVAGVGTSNVNVPGNGFVGGIAGNLTHPNGKTTAIQNGMVLTFDPNTDNEETVQVVNGGATFTKSHGINCTIINRGNPGPWAGYDRTKDRDVVPYAEIIE